MNNKKKYGCSCSVSEGLSYSKMKGLLQNPTKSYELNEPWLDLLKVTLEAGN